MGTTWEIGGRTFTLDLDTVEGLARYDDALAKQKSVFAELPAGASEPRQLLAYCAGIRMLIDTLFGDGVTSGLLGEDAPVSAYDTLYESFADFVHDQTEEHAKRREAILNKYKPQPNREQRRAVENFLKKFGEKQ